MLIKDKLSRISLQSLIPSKKTPPVIATEEPLSSSPFVMPKSSAAEAPFTGRVKELDLLRSLYRELNSLRSASGRTKNTQSKPLIIGIKGEAGIGKSRLVTEFQNNITAFHNGKSFIYREGCLSSGQEGYGLFRGFFSGSNILKQAATSERKTLIQNKISGSILSLAREAAKNNLPMVIMLEDMQWADELSLAALDHFVSAFSIAAGEEGLMLLLILNYRQTYRPWRILRKECRFVEIELKGFGEIETKQFISKLTGRKNISPNILEQISRRSEGNPFNIEEICRSFDAGSKNLKIPATVKGLLADKVSQLEKDERAVLIIASVLGRKFSVKLLNAILKKAGKQPAGTDVMKRLEEKKYLVNLTSDVYEFRHDLLHEIIYRQLIKDLRKNVHTLAAAATEELYSASLTAHYYELARHYEAAGDESNIIKYLELAGDRAKDNYENTRAERYYNKLLKLGGDSAKNISIQLKLCDVYMNRDQWDKQIEVCEQLLKKTGKIDRKSRIECYARMGLALRLKGNYKEALLTFRKERKFLASNATTEKLAVAERIANVYKDMGKYENAMRIFEEVNINSKLFSNNDLYKGSLVGLGIVYTKTGKYSDAIKSNSELLKYSELNNDKQAAIKAYINKAESHYYLGEYNEAQSCYINGLKIAKKVYRIHDAILCLANLGNIFYSKGQYNKATKIYHKLKVSFGYLGDKAGTASVMCSLGICKIAAGDYPLAIEYLEKHLTLSKNLKRESSIALSYCNLGVVYNLMGDFATAKKYFRSQLRIDERIGNWEGIVRAFINIAIQYKNIEKYSKALKNLERASKIIGKKGIKTYNALLYLNLSEVHLALGGISESIKFSQLATEEAKENENIEIEILASGVLTRARVIQLLENKRAFSNGELKKATCLLKDFRSRSQSTKNREFKGNILFESYIIGKMLVDKGINLNIKDIRSKAIKIFEDLYKNSPQYEFFSKIKILKKDTFQ